MIRTTTTRLTTGAVALSLLLAGSAALAAQGFRGGRQGAPGTGLRDALATLDLSDVQKAKVKELMDGERPKVQALRQEGRSAREALRTAAQAPTPDPATVGSAYLRLGASRKAMRAERDSSRQKLESFLTAEQKAKLEGWIGAHRQMRRGALGAAQGGAGGPGPGPQSY